MGKPRGGRGFYVESFYFIMEARVWKILIDSSYSCLEVLFSIVSTTYFLLTSMLSASISPVGIKIIFCADNKEVTTNNRKRNIFSYLVFDKQCIIFLITLKMSC